IADGVERRRLVLICLHVTPLIQLLEPKQIANPVNAFARSVRANPLPIVLPKSDGSLPAIIVTIDTACLRIGQISPPERKARVQFRVWKVVLFPILGALTHIPAISRHITGY